MSYSIAKDFRIFFITKVRTADYDHDGIHVALHDRGRNLHFPPCRNRRTFRNQYCISSAEPRDRHRRHARNRRKCDHREKDGGGKDAGSAGRLLFPDRYRNHPRIPCDVSRKHIYNSARTTARRNRSDPGSLHRIFKRIPFFGACLYLTTALSGIFCHCRKTDHRTDSHDQRRRCQYDP